MRSFFDFFSNIHIKNDGIIVAGTICGIPPSA